MKRFFSLIIVVFVLMSSCNKVDDASNKKPSNDELFTEYFNSNAIDQQRGIGENEAGNKFMQKDYDSAAILYKEIIKKDTGNIAAKFYYGVTNIKTNNIDNSINTFKDIINENDNLYIEQSLWFLGLCYLKTNQTNAAIYQFMIIAADSSNFYNEDAKNILNKINYTINTHKLDSIHKNLHLQTLYVDNLINTYKK